MYLEASKPKRVNSMKNIIGVNSIRLAGLHYKVTYMVLTYHKYIIFYNTFIINGGLQGRMMQPPKSLQRLCCCYLNDSPQLAFGGYISLPCRLLNICQLYKVKTTSD